MRIPRTAALLLISASLLGGADGSRKVWTFDDDALGKVASGFSVASGRWEVARDGGKGVLVQTGKSEDAAFHVVLVGATDARDLDLSVRLRAVSGEVDQGGGLIWRARDAKNYYLARFNPLESNFRLYKVVDGVRTQLKSARVDDAEGWQTLRVTMAGSRIRCYLNGQPHLEADDVTFVGPGKIGLWTKSDARTEFDDLTLSH